MKIKSDSPVFAICQLPTAAASFFRLLIIALRPLLSASCLLPPSSCLLLISALFFLNSCRKNDISLPYKSFSVGENINLKKIIFRNDTVGFCCGGTKNQYGAIFRTSTAGTSWTKVMSSNFACINDVYFLNDSIGYACGDSLKLFKTTDRGFTWCEYIFSNFPWKQYMVPINSIFFQSETTAFLAAGEHYSKGNLSTTFNGGQPWHHQSYDNEFDCILFTDITTGYMSGYGVIYKTIDGGHSFFPLNIRNDWFVSLSFYNTSLGFAAGYNGAIYKTTDAGQKWEYVLKENSMFSSRIHFKQIKFSDPNQGYAVGLNGLFISSIDGGNNWNSLGKLTEENLNSIEISKNKKIYICTGSGNVLQLDNQ